MNSSVNAPFHKTGTIKEFVFAAIIIVVAFGAGYMIYRAANDPSQIAPLKEAETYSEENDLVANSLKTQSSGDDLYSINKDLSATDFSQIDK